MPKEKTRMFYEEVRKEYLELTSKKDRGIPVYNRDVVMLWLADKFYRSPKTIENIVFNRVRE